MAPFYAATRRLLLGLLLPLAAVAQDPYQGALRVTATDGTPLAVSIDGRRYKHVGQRLLIGDLPTGRHRLRIYAVYANRGDDGATGETVYRGVFYAEPGTWTECVVDAGRGTAQVRTVNAASRHSDGPDGYTGGTPLPRVTDPNEYGAGTANGRGTGSGLSDADLDALRQRVADRITDGDKLQTMQAALDRKTVRSADVRAMLSWLSFDSTRLEFAKWAYAHVSDRADYWKLEDAFSFDSTKTDFNTFVRGAR